MKHELLHAENTIDLMRAGLDKLEAVLPEKEKELQQKRDTLLEVCLVCVMASCGTHTEHIVRSIPIAFLLTGCALRLDDGVQCIHSWMDVDAMMCNGGVCMPECMQAQQIDHLRLQEQHTLWKLAWHDVCTPLKQSITLLEV